MEPNGLYRPFGSSGTLRTGDFAPSSGFYTPAASSNSFLLPKMLPTRLAGWLRVRVAAFVPAVLGLALLPSAAFAQSLLPAIPTGSVFQNVPEASSYGVVYELNIPASAQYNFNPIAYAQDHSALVANGAFT